MSMNAEHENFNNSGPWGPASRESTPTRRREREVPNAPAPRRTRARVDPRGRKSKYWCFTINNPHPDTERVLDAMGNSGLITTYLVWGREVGENGTPHLQGYVEFRSRWDLLRCQRSFMRGAHYEQRRGTPQEAAEYCKKDGQYTEHGTISRGLIGPILSPRINRIN